MTLEELVNAVQAMIADAQGNGIIAAHVTVKTITDRGAVKDIKGYRPFDTRTGGPVLLIK